MNFAEKIKGFNVTNNTKIIFYRKEKNKNKYIYKYICTTNMKSETMETYGKEEVEKIVIAYANGQYIGEINVYI